MKKYTGTKNILARPMTRGEYNNYRNWACPDDENPDDPGYLVEYLDGGAQNHPSHQGYISWSPNGVFERTYRVSETFKDRLQIELSDLQAKHDLLLAFLPSDKCLALPKEDQDLLTAQLAAMRDYLNILNDRIVRVT